MSRWNVLFVVSAMALAAGCTCNPSATNRSGTLDEPYVEEPLAAGSADKEPFLAASNAVVAAIASGDREAAYAWMDRKGVQLDKFETSLDFIQTAHGSIVDFKPLQWWFIDDGRQLMSVKLLVFERGCGAVRMMFDPEEPTRVLRLWIGGNTCSANADEARNERRIDADGKTDDEQAPLSP